MADVAQRHQQGQAILKRSGIRRLRRRTGIVRGLHMVGISFVLRGFSSRRLLRGSPGLSILASLCLGRTGEGTPCRMGIRGDRLRRLLALQGRLLGAIHHLAEIRAFFLPVGSVLPR
ncbi:hypothetical protein, partial [Mesorhizobium sp. M1E.F.Ca.ET.063.01.1.1]|uniref:hypothetical protein n=1 Tax=Mesorhizobium sp. M1E.F.Ca.ET.063.01.1.1 TaxID=2496750 RepID=UPI001AED0903